MVEVVSNKGVEARAELEAGHEEGKRLHAEAVALFDNPPEGAVVRTREEAGWQIHDESQKEDHLLCKTVSYPREEKKVEATLYRPVGGENPGGITFIVDGRMITKWLTPDGVIHGVGVRTEAERAKNEQEERGNIKAWLDAFRA